MNTQKKKRKFGAAPPSTRSRVHAVPRPVRPYAQPAPAWARTRHSTLHRQAIASLEPTTASIGLMPARTHTRRRPKATPSATAGPLRLMHTAPHGCVQCWSAARPAPRDTKLAAMHTCRTRSVFAVQCGPTVRDSASSATCENMHVTSNRLLHLCNTRIVSLVIESRLANRSYISQTVDSI